MAFCERFGCSAAEFERRVLRRSFPASSRLLGSLLLAVSPRLFQRELEMIRRLGTAVDHNHVRGELEGYKYENQRDRVLRTETLGLRVSGRRLMQLYRETIPPPPLPPAISPHARTANPGSPEKAVPA